jgi:hypothetical protein
MREDQHNKGFSIYHVSQHSPRSIPGLGATFPCQAASFFLHLVLARAARIRTPVRRRQSRRGPACGGKDKWGEARRGETVYVHPQGRWGEGLYCRSASGWIVFPCLAGECGTCVGLEMEVLGCLFP